jgi:hypothetical protein
MHTGLSKSTAGCEHPGPGQEDPQGERSPIGVFVGGQPPSEVDLGSTVEI